MSTEYFDIVDENNVPTGEIKSREEVHRERKDWHRTVSAWIINDQGEFLCQQRSWKKDGNPGMWQSYFGGHVKSGQTNEEGLREELMEEIGIDIQQTPEQPVFINTGTGHKNKHFGYYYVLIWNGTMEDITFNDGEVEQVAWLSLESLKARMVAGEFCNEMSPKILEYLKSMKIPNSNS